jgi:hypothetical protein
MLRVSSFGSVGPSPSSAGNTQGLRPAMRFRRLNCSNAGGVNGTEKAIPVLVRSARISQSGASASRSNSDQRAPVSSDRRTAVRRISRMAIPVRFARLVTSSTLVRRAASSASSRARWRGRSVPPERKSSCTGEDSTICRWMPYRNNWESNPATRLPGNPRGARGRKFESRRPDQVLTRVSLPAPAWRLQIGSIPPAHCCAKKRESASRLSSIGVLMPAAARLLIRRRIAMAPAHAAVGRVRQHQPFVGIETPVRQHAVDPDHL